MDINNPPATFPPDPTLEWSDDDIRNEIGILAQYLHDLEWSDSYGTVQRMKETEREINRLKNILRDRGQPVPDTHKTGLL